jgi:hypothetical protein
LAKVNYAKDNVLRNFALMGTYSTTAAEQDLLKMCMKNVGVKILRNTICGLMRELCRHILVLKALTVKIAPL